MSTRGSVTVWIAELKAGDKLAAERLWENYFKRLVNLARHKLRRGPRAARDEEDVALSAFKSFFRGVEDSRFPRLDDRDDLWQLLVLLTARKAYRMLKHELRAKRGGGKVRSLSAIADESGAVEVIGREPTPEFAALVAEEYRQRLNALKDEHLQEVAVAKLEGFTNARIAAALHVDKRTVERRLGLIRRLWQDPKGKK
jgi:DNA-directed RNA polymerase specialized sigma24 family protein